MNNLHKLFYPESVAVAGVSPRPDNLASMILRNLENWKFQGATYGVNPVRQEPVNGFQVFPTLTDIPGPVDVLTILSPARTVPDLLDQCAEKGTRFAIVETAGFSELNGAGAQLGEIIREKAREHGIGLVGPNCLGIINAEIGLCSPFSYILPFPCGNISVLSQSGGVGLALILGLHEHNLYANKMVSMGNKYGLHESDYLEYLVQDPGTDVIVMFLEGIVDGRRFAQAASRSPKPIIVYKGNVTAAGQQRASSHTAALANNDAVVDAALKQAGVVRVKNLTDLIHYARMFTQPKFRGNRITVISPAGGYTVVAADECSAAGFTFPQPGEKTMAAVQARVRAGVINIENPMDLGDAFSAETVLLALEHSLDQPDVDGALVMIQRRTKDHYVGPFQVMAHNIVPDVQELVTRKNKPVAVNLFALPSVSEEVRGEATIPVYTSMDVTVRAMGAFLKYCTAQAQRLPVAMKITSADLSHKSDVGGVILNILTLKAVEQAARNLFRIMKKARAEGAVLVQKMSPAGVECLVGARNDPAFGPVIVFGLGGVFVEVLRDTALRMAPVNRAQAWDMIHSISGAPLLLGARGRAPIHMASLEKTIVDVSRLMAAADLIEELDINPLIATESGCIAVDARIGLRR